MALSVHGFFWNSFFHFQSKNEFKNLDFSFLKLVLNQNRFKKFFCLFFVFQFNNQNWKMKDIFEIRFLISNQKTNFKIFTFVFRFLIWNGPHQRVFWQVGSRIELQLLWNWIKLFRTFTTVGWRLKWTS